MIFFNQGCQVQVARGSLIVKIKTHLRNVLKKWFIYDEETVGTFCTTNMEQGESALCHVDNNMLTLFCVELEIKIRIVCGHLSQ